MPRWDLITLDMPSWGWNGHPWNPSGSFLCCEQPCHWGTIFKHKELNRSLGHHLIASQDKISELKVSRYSIRSSFSDRKDPT